MKEPGTCHPERSERSLESFLSREQWITGEILCSAQDDRRLVLLRAWRTDIPLTSHVSATTLSAVGRTLGGRPVCAGAGESFMNKLAFLLLLLLACPILNAAGQQSGGLKVSVQGAIKPEWRQPLTNESIMGLVKIGFSDETILAMIEHEDGKYSLAPIDVIALREAGVSEKVIRAMLSKSASDQAATSHSPVTQTPAQATATLVCIIHERDLRTRI